MQYILTEEEYSNMCSKNKYNSMRNSLLDDIEKIEAENKKLREALKEAIPLMQNTAEYEIKCKPYVVCVDKAKQLIEEGEE